MDPLGWLGCNVVPGYAQYPGHLLREAVSDGVILLIHREAADDKIPLRSLLENPSVESEARNLVFPDNTYASGNVAQRPILRTPE